MRYIIDVATFDFLPVELIWYLFDFPEAGAFSLNFQASGYEYMFILENMGTFFFLVQIYLLGSMLTIAIGLLALKIYQLRNIHNKIKKQLFWPVALRLLFEAYLQLCICVAIGLINLSWSDKSFSIMYCTIFTLCFAVIVLCIPFYVSVFYYCKLDKVEDENFKQKYGNLYEGL